MRIAIGKPEESFKPKKAKGKLKKSQRKGKGKPEECHKESHRIATGKSEETLTDS
jgi:hypothetical protein